MLRTVRDIVGDDEEALADTVEGETGLMEAIDGAVAQMDECDILLTGIAAKMADLTARKKSAEDRQMHLRAAIEQALVVLDMREPLRRPTMTLSIRKTPPGLIITDESAIPPKFWKQKPAPDPTLDKKALTDALGALPKGEHIPGASLDNGGVSLFVRRR
ncbi:siphovirus Gp157 family protein [Amorphus sp. MBR-141]